MATNRGGHRDIVALGASAGGVEALRETVAGLPADLPAAVLVVLHMPAHSHSSLASILDRAGPLPAVPARSGAALTPGLIHVGVPDHHLLVADGSVLLSKAPKQNRVRPAVDALFRSVARWYGRRAVAVMLSGTLDDGAAGLAAVDAVGGVCVVQDPSDALFSEMPYAGLSVVPGALVRPAAAIGPAVAALFAEPLGAARLADPDADLVTEADMATNESIDREGGLPGSPAAVSCPDCSGGMNRVLTGAAVHYACHIGHIWSPRSLLAAQREKVEQSMWTAVSMLEEQANVHDDLAGRAAGHLSSRTEQHQRAAAVEIRQAAETIRKHFPELVPQVVAEAITPALPQPAA